MKEKVYIHIKIKQELRKKLKSEAEAKGMSLNAYVNLVLSERNKC